MIGNLKMYARVAVVAIGVTSFGMGPALARATAQDRDHQDNHSQNQDEHHDWSNNSFYQMGQREAEQDRKHNKQRKHNHHYKNDDDRSAYEAGYQASWNNGHNDEHPH